MTTESETGVGPLQAKESLESREAGGGKEGFSLSLQRERELADTDFGLLASGTVRECISLILNHRVPGRLLKHT